jgi:hypothetical protein
MFKIGTRSITIAVMGEKAKINLIELRNIFYVSEMLTNLFSLPTIIDKDYDFTIS